MNGKDWKIVMEEAGFPYIDYVKSARESVDRKSGGWAYRVVDVDIEIRRPSGYYFRTRVKVDLQQLETAQEPINFLCREVRIPIEKALKEEGG